MSAVRRIDDEAERWDKRQRFVDDVEGRCEYIELLQSEVGIRVVEDFLKFNPSSCNGTGEVEGLLLVSSGWCMGRNCSLVFDG